MIKIIFFGTGKYVLPILEVLNSDFELSLVLTTEKSDGDPISKFSEGRDIELISVAKFDEDVALEIKKSGADVAVLANFGLILSQEILDLFPKGIINVHPSLLPKYRGTTPGQTALLNGDKITGVSIIKLDREMDHGHILAQQEEPILDNDTSETLYPRLFKIGAKLLHNSLRRYLSGELKLTEQDHSKVTFTKPLTRDDGYIDISIIPSAEILDRMIRAYFPWPGVWFKTNLNGTDKIIKLLPENKIQVEGKNSMPYKDFINGYPEIGKEILSKLKLA